MPIYYIFPICVGLFFLVYFLIILPKIKGKADKTYATQMEENYLKFKGNEQKHRNEYAQNSEYIKHIAVSIPDEPIRGVVSCMERREFKDVVRQVGVNIAGKVVGKVTGFGFKEVDNYDNYYLLITEKHLYYLHYDGNGDCIEKLSFYLDLIENFVVGNANSKDMLQYNATLGSSKRINFTYDGKKRQFFYYQVLLPHPLAQVKKYFKNNELASVNYLFVEPFKDFIKKYSKNI